MGVLTRYGNTLLELVSAKHPKSDHPLGRDAAVMARLPCCVERYWVRALLPSGDAVVRSSACIMQERRSMMALLPLPIG